MQAYVERARGILDVQRQLNLAFDETGETVDLMRQGYRTLTHETLAAIQAMGRVTGRFEPGAAAAAPGAAAAYGIPAGQAGHLAGTLAMRVSPYGEPLARALAGSPRVLWPGRAADGWWPPG